MIELIGIIGLMILFPIYVATYDKWSYKQWYYRCKKKAEEENNHDKSTN